MAQIHTSAYKFVTLNALPTLRDTLQQQCEQQGLLGTILLSEEGVNIMLAGEEAGVYAFQSWLSSQADFADIVFKDSIETKPCFTKLKVRIKPEIITFKVPGLDPEHAPTAHLSPETFKQWLDEGKDILVLDTRNDYEVQEGTFSNAVDLNISHFTEFTEAVDELDESLKDKPLVMFCTGGVRCEKAGPFMQQKGFKEVYQLEGGIINYFKQCGGEHWQGQCFVFDDRLLIEPEDMLS